MSDLPGTVLNRLTAAFESGRDRERAFGAEAYMRDQFAFLGLSAPDRRRSTRAALAGLPPPTPSELTGIALACWARDEREYQYFACDHLAAHRTLPGPDFLPTLRVLITTKSWWDTVDPLATTFLGALVRRHPTLVTELDAWSAADDPWLIRSAVLHQLKYGPATDTDRLFDYCARQAGHRDFFVRKAIGWALRQYARTDPGAVRAFLAEQGDRLSTLSVREASKHL